MHLQIKHTKVKLLEEFFFSLNMWDVRFKTLKNTKLLPEKFGVRKTD